MVHGQLGVAIGQVLDLLLLRHNLLVQQIDLLGGNGFLVLSSWLARGRGFSSDIIQRILIVGAKFGVFEFPSLRHGLDAMPRIKEVKNVRSAYIRTIRRLPVFLVILANFVEIILVQLADETGKVAVLEMSG